MAKFERSAGSRPVVVGPQTGVDKATYADRAMAFIGSKGGEGFVIRGLEGPKGEFASKYPATDAQWIAWMGYLAKIEVPTKAMRAHGLGTVPAEWPEDFDASVRPSDHRARLDRPYAEIDPDRARTAAQVKGRVDAAVASSQFPHTKRRQNWEMSPQEAAEMVREIASKPVPQMSESLRASLGIARKDAAA